MAQSVFVEGADGRATNAPALANTPHRIARWFGLVDREPSFFDTWVQSSQPEIFPVVMGAAGGTELPGLAPVVDSQRAAIVVDDVAGWNSPVIQSQPIQFSMSGGTYHAENAAPVAAASAARDLSVPMPSKSSRAIEFSSISSPEFDSPTRSVGGPDEPGAAFPIIVTPPIPPNPAVISPEPNALALGAIFLGAWQIFSPRRKRV